MVILTELLPGSSSSSSSTHDHNHRYVYDVFLSFRGADTRNRFTDHLYNTLLDASIITFLDDEEIDTGEPLKPELESAIRSSRASIIVLSKNYASSTWCLDELVLILEQKRTSKQIVIPIFYDVEPTDVRKQQSSFGEAMGKHKQKMEAETNAEKINQWALKLELWKKALTEVADLKGKDAKDRKETDFIIEVVTEIHRRLRVPLCNTLPRLIGMDYDIEFIGSWLTDGSCHTADILTIVGMGGIGKTSLARYVFRLHSSKFDKSSFIEGINIRCEERYNGLLDLQKQLHGDISKKFPLQVNDVIEYTSKIEHVLARKKVFIVLDDIGSLDQLNALLGNKGLHPGSKIIITTRDASLTESCALFSSQVHHNHSQVSLDGLGYLSSLKLLCIHAFNSQEPKVGYEDVSKELVKYCQGHPLALEVLGGSLHKKTVSYLENYIKVLKEEPHSRINKALKMSFDSLPLNNDKVLFKHIACFFVGIDRDLTETILNACNIDTRSGITTLIDKCLLSIGWDNELIMHQLVQEMGRDLVRQESPDKPWKRSLLWCHKESFNVLRQKKGKENLLGLALDMRMLDKLKLCRPFELRTESFSQMHNLKLLQLNYVQLDGCFKNFPEELRWLCMHGSPLKSIPLDLPMENVVVLDMSYSNIEYFDMSNNNPQPPEKRQKMYYEFGIFSTIYLGEGMPGFISFRNEGPSISLTIPSSPKKLKGLNFCCTMDTTKLSNTILCLPVIKISNVTKNLTWSYYYCHKSVRLDEKCGLSLLSHWKFGPSEMKDGDHITITVVDIMDVFDQVIKECEVIKECGIGLVYEEEKEEEEDVLGYYKSWNYIIGGDLSCYQLLTGEYKLLNQYIDKWYKSTTLCELYKFKAFSQKKGRFQHPNPSLSV